MRSMLTLLLLLPFLVYFSLWSVATPYLAITRVPVADLLGESAQKISSNKNVASCYHQLPLCIQKAPHCSRIHQLLFHEIVTVLEEKKDEVYISIPSVFFETQNDTKKNSAYWALKKNFIPISQLEKNGIDISLLPEPVAYNQTKKTRAQHVVTLIMPFFDHHSKRTLSAGTRFVVKGHDEHSFSGYALSPSGTELNVLQLPRNLVVATSDARTREQQITTFLAILHQWAHQHHGCIPYVWGGSSFTALDHDGDFIKKKVSGHSTELTFVRPHYSHIPKTGFDCTGLLTRAAQIAGLPYYFKNSTTILKHLQPVSSSGSVHNGDIIWIPGHIMVISDVNKNLIIEARSYEHGWGKIHEAPINHIFHNIHTLAQLLSKCSSNTPLKRLAKDGAIAQDIFQCKILSLRSLWHVH